MYNESAGLRRKGLSEIAIQICFSTPRLSDGPAWPCVALGFKRTTGVRFRLSLKISDAYRQQPSVTWYPDGGPMANKLDPIDSRLQVKWEAVERSGRNGRSRSDLNRRFVIAVHQNIHRVRLFDRP